MLCLNFHFSGGEKWSESVPKDFKEVLPLAGNVRTKLALLLCAARSLPLMYTQKTVMYPTVCKDQTFSIHGQFICTLFA